MCIVKNADDAIAVMSPHMAALQQQQHHQRSRMLGLMHSQSSAVNQPQFPATAARMPSSSFQAVNNTAAATAPRSLFPSATEAPAPNSDSVYYPRPPPPVLSACNFTTSSLLWNTGKHLVLVALCFHVVHPAWL